VRKISQIDKTNLRVNCDYVNSNQSKLYA